MKNLLTLLFFLVLSACTKNDAGPQDQLPPATTFGANTAGCYINGELLTPKNGSQEIGGSAAYGLTTGAGNNFHPPVIGDDYFYLRIANLKDLGGDSIYLQINDMTMGLGNYIVGQSNNDYFDDGPNNPQVILHIFDGSNIGKVFLSSPDSGVITFTRFDYSNGIYSGIFNVTVYNKDNPSEKVHVTDGRFDLKLATLNR